MIQIKSMYCLYVIPCLSKTGPDTRAMNHPFHRALRSDRLFFPAACLLAVVVVLQRGLDYWGRSPLTDLPPFWHGHEMLFGFAPALMAGYLLTGLRSRTVLIVFAAWLSARLMILWSPSEFLIVAPAMLAFPAALAMLAGGRLLTSAKSLRNAVFPLVLIVIFLAESLYLIGWPGQGGDASAAGLSLMSGLVVLMLFAMGGRIIAAATSGAHQALGRSLERAAHADLEKIGVPLLAASALLDTLDRAAVLSGGLSLAAGMVVLLRLWRWRVWLTPGERTLSFLHLGYGLLGLGLLLKGWAGLGGDIPFFSAYHLVYVGALGLLGGHIMTRVRLQRDRRSLAMGPMAFTALLLIALALPFRLLALAAGYQPQALLLAAGFWSAGFGLLLVWLLVQPFRPRNSGRKPSANSR